MGRMGSGATAWRGRGWQDAGHHWNGADLSGSRPASGGGRLGGSLQHSASAAHRLRDNGNQGEDGSDGSGQHHRGARRAEGAPLRELTSRKPRGVIRGMDLFGKVPLVEIPILITADQKTWLETL